MVMWPIAELERVVLASVATEAVAVAAAGAVAAAMAGMDWEKAVSLAAEVTARRVNSSSVMSHSHPVMAAATGLAH